MKDKKRIVIIFVLIIIYLFSAAINSLFISNYIVYSNKVYKIKRNDLSLSNSANITNKKINLVNKRFSLENAYYKKDNSGNNELFLYDKNYKSINKDRYYYGYTNDMNILEFKENSSITNSDIKKISDILSKDDITFSIKEFNYYNIINYKDNKLIILGNFNDMANFGRTSNDLTKDKYYEYIIVKSDNKIQLAKKIMVDKKDFFNTDFLLFDCILEINNNYYVGMEQVNYSFFEGDSKNLYKLENKLRVIE